MFKVFLLMAVIMSCGSIGLIKSSTYTSRVKELNQLRNILRILETEIYYKKEALPVIFQRISSADNLTAFRLFGKCLEYMQKHYDIAKCWKTSVYDIYGKSCLSKSDLQILCELGPLLGNSNVTGQSNAINLIDEKLKHQIFEAENDRKSKGKMYGGMGFTMGIVIAVLLV